MQSPWRLPRPAGKPAATCSEAGLRRLNQPAQAGFAIRCRGFTRPADDLARALARRSGALTPARVSATMLAGEVCIPGACEGFMTSTADIVDLIAQTDAVKAPVRLEYVRGRAKWEASPASRHQKVLQRIERSLRPIPEHPEGCGCFALQDTLIRFPDTEHSLKRPDLAIFCVEPPDSDEALDLLPAAVVEVLSVGYEEKDLGCRALLPAAPMPAAPPSAGACPRSRCGWYSR
jgi:hypothetical protein